MDFKTLKTFQLIVKYGSFNRAAEEMNYAQSTVTMQIQKLESDLGMQLIERGKKIRLTEAGRMFHEQSLQIVKNMEQLQTNMADLQLGEAGSIRIGVTEPTASHRLPVILEKFIAHFPKIRVSVDISSTAVLSERILKGEIDFALCSVPDLGSEIYFEPMFREEFVVLMPESHPLAHKTQITLDDIHKVRLLVTSTTCPYRRKLEMVLQESGNVGLDTMEIGSMTALVHYVQTGLGIAFVPKMIVNPVPIGTKVHTIADCQIDMTIGILCKSSEYPLKRACSKLYEFLKQDLCDK